MNAFQNVFFSICHLTLLGEENESIFLRVLVSHVLKGKIIF